MSILFSLSLTVFLFWVLVVLDVSRRWPAQHRLMLSARTGGISLAAQDTAVIIPARNEEDCVRECLSSLLEQENEFAQLLYIDDRSTDRTKAIAQELADASAAAKAQVIAGKPPPGDWSGKLFALAQGVALICADNDAKNIRWFLFTDADILHPKGSINALRTLAAQGSYDLVSVMVRLCAHSFWEKLLIPPFVYFFQLLYPFRRVSHSSEKYAAAAGGCILVSREMVGKLDGLSIIRDAVIDDISLACKVREAGGRLWLGICPEMESRRAYPKLKDIVQMVSRTAFTQLRYSASLLLICITGLLLFLISPSWLCLLAVSMGQPLALLLAAGAWALQTYTLYPVVKHHRVKKIYALSLPFASLLYCWMTLLSAWRYWRGKGVAWRGRRLGASSKR